LAKAYHPEVTRLVGDHCPEGTRPVETMRFCFCGGNFERGRCMADDCPRAILGLGSWYKALPKLQKLRNRNELEDRYPELNLPDLQAYLERVGRELEEKRSAWIFRERDQRGQRRPARGQWGDDQHVGGNTSEMISTWEAWTSTTIGEQQGQPEGKRRVWRQPRQTTSPPPGASGATSSGANSSTPNASGVKLEPATLPLQKITREPVDVASDDAEEMADGAGYASEITLLDSDESGASIFGLRRALHEVEEGDELSDVSSRDDDERAVAEKERVNKWRAENLLQDNLDFAYVYVDFEEAYSQAGRAVAVAWSRARVSAEPGMAADMAKISAVEATATKIRKVDERRKASVSKKKMAKAPLLRQPGEGMEVEETEEDKVRFIEPLAQLMMDCGVGRVENTSATDQELIASLQRKAARIVKASEIPTLHKAITTADEVRKYLESRTMYTGVDNVEPIVLEEFLGQSRARVRAANAIAWMCKNLKLGWPIDKMEEPDGLTAWMSVVGMECKQAPTAHLGMFQALADTMEAAAETDNPMWLALLASWLQAMANLRLVHVLRRSVPVEVYDGWMLFFCKRGRRKHNRSGFYWGVPSTTSGDYNWTEKFLIEYNRRRKSEVGTEMMGMIFRTDTHEYLSSKSVNAMTMNAVAGVLEDPELLTTYSWRGLLPAIARLLNFSPAERFAVGDWGGEAREMGDEVPITQKYAEGKEGRSRVCKLICAAAITSLAKKDTQTFDEIPAQQWELLAEQARTEVGSKPLGTNAVWRNPDLADAGGGFKVKKSQITFPKQLAGVPLAPTSRDGQRYCVDFQSGVCRQMRAETTCQLGLHKCAAVFRSGRTCHGNHPGFECRNTKKHAIAEDPVTEEGPILKKVKVELIDKPDVEVVEAPNPYNLWHVRDDSIMRRLLPGLRKERSEVRGNRINPEPPRLVAKICEGRGRGELWLGPLPTANRMDTIMETKFSIQIYCFLKHPTEVAVGLCGYGDDGGDGMIIPDTVQFRCEMSNPHARLADMRMLKSCLVNSLRQGDNAYVHCVSGISRAPMAAAVMSAMLMGITFEEAQGIIDQTRNVSFAKGEQRMQGAWIYRVLREPVTNAEVPTGFSCSAVKQGAVLVHATIVDRGDTEPICRWKREACTFRGLIMTRDTVEQMSSQFGGKFCANCQALMKASLRLQVDHFYGENQA